MKSTTIRDNCDLGDVSLDEIYGIFKTPELEMEQKSKRKRRKAKTVALGVEEKTIESQDY